MKKEIKISSKKEKSSKCALVCWVIIPLAIIIILLLDGLGLYPFTTERMIVMGVGLLVVLLPFFSEITVKNFSIKKEDDK